MRVFFFGEGYRRYPTLRNSFAKKLSRILKKWLQKVKLEGNIQAKLQELQQENVGFFVLCKVMVLIKEEWSKRKV